MKIDHLFLILLVLINIASFMMVYFDKQNSIGHTERTPEVNFFVWAIFFSSVGVLAGMFTFRHKTRKMNFVFGIGLLFIQQVVLAYLIFDKIINS